MPPCIGLHNWCPIPFAGCVIGLAGAELAEPEAESIKKMGMEDVGTVVDWCRRHPDVCDIFCLGCGHRGRKPHSLTQFARSNYPYSVDSSLHVSVLFFHPYRQFGLSQPDETEPIAEIGSTYMYARIWTISRYTGVSPTLPMNLAAPHGTHSFPATTLAVDSWGYSAEVEPRYSVRPHFHPAVLGSPPISTRS